MSIRQQNLRCYPERQESDRHQHSNDKPLHSRCLWNSQDQPESEPSDSKLDKIPQPKIQPIEFRCQISQKVPGLVMANLFDHFSEGRVSGVGKQSIDCVEVLHSDHAHAHRSHQPNAKTKCSGFPFHRSGDFLLRCSYFLCSSDDNGYTYRNRCILDLSSSRSWGF